jgi:uncharacterized protein involved in exopolysaccharide biosynthesis
VEEIKTQDEDKINLLDYFLVIHKRRKMILKVTLGLALFVTVLVFIMADKYQAEVRFLPPQSTASSLAAAMLGTTGSSSSTVSALAGGLFGTTAPGGMYVGLLSSRPVLDKVIDRYDLMNRYKTGIYYVLHLYREDVIDKLTSDVMAASINTDSGIVSVTVFDSDPKVAANMANTFLDEMENLYRSMAVVEASRRKLYYENQLKSVKEELGKAEDDMKAYQEKTGILQVDAQAQAVITSDAAMRAQIAAKEVDVKVLKTFATPNNPDLQKAEDALRALKAEQTRIEAKQGSGPDPLMSIGRMPEAGLEYARKMRNVKFNEALYAILVGAVEAAKMDEAKTTAVVQEVQRAVAPTKAAKPNRPLYITAAALLGFFFSVVAAFIGEFKERALQNPRNKDKMEQLLSCCRKGKA